MKPTFADGDVLLVDTGTRAAEVDGVYVLEVHEQLYIKRVSRRFDGRHEISSDNPSVKTVEVLNGDHSVEIKGRVVWAWKGERL
jgi:phage repressor protein C with HTH and peptisase S24 domain